MSENVNIEQYLQTKDIDEEQAANISILKSEETNMLENIAVNFERLNQNMLSNSVTPCLSVRTSQNQWRKQQYMRPNIPKTPNNLQTFDREKMNTFMSPESEDIQNQFGRTQ